MLIWRGKGLLVLLFYALGLGVPALVAGAMADQAYPDVDYAWTLYSHTSPVTDISLIIGFATAAVVTWVVGRRINRNGGGHSLFFIPVQWWAIPPILFAVIGLRMLSPESRARGLESAFVSKCERHEEGANEEQCTCWARVMMSDTPQSLHAPFMSALIDAYGSSEVGVEDRVLNEFMTTVLEEASPKDQAAFIDASTRVGAECLR